MEEEMPGCLCFRSCQMRVSLWVQFGAAIEKLPARNGVSFVPRWREVHDQNFT